MKMAFDVTPVYDFLLQNGCVYTVRPTYLRYASSFSEDVPVHIHRKHKWEGHIARKKLVAIGHGMESVLKSMAEYVGYSGFPDVESWYSGLIRMHGNPEMGYWGIWLVQLEYPNMEDYCSKCGSSNVVFKKTVVKIEGEKIHTETVICEDCGAESLLHHENTVVEKTGTFPVYGHTTTNP